MNLPNSLTVLRIFFVPLLIAVLLTRAPNLEVWGVQVHFEVWGVLILLTAAATDWADGYFARRRLEVTTLGILLDPIADKLLITAAFISLVDMRLEPGGRLREAAPASALAGARKKNAGCRRFLKTISGLCSSWRVVRLWRLCPTCKCSRFPP